MVFLEIPDSAVHLMKLHGVIDPFPQIAMRDGRHFSQVFPLPAILAPDGEPVTDTVSDHSAGRNQGNAGDLFQSLQTSHNSQQLQPLPPHSRFLLRDLGAMVGADFFQHKTPDTTAIFGVHTGLGLSQQQVMGSG